MSIRDSDSPSCCRRLTGFDVPNHKLISRSALLKITLGFPSVCRRYINTRRSQHAQAVHGNRVSTTTTTRVPTDHDEQRAAFCFASCWFSLPMSCLLPHRCSRNDARRLRSAATSLPHEGAFSNVEKRLFHSSTFQYLPHGELLCIIMVSG
jgi:hypothetical protein